MAADIAVHLEQIDKPETFHQSIINSQIYRKSLFIGLTH